MDIFVVYIFHQIVFRVSTFLRHWYVGAFFYLAHFFISLIDNLDKSIALKVTWRNLFEPLYQDHSIIGYVLGFVFRFFRLVLGGLMYAVIILVGVIVYLLWAVLPLYLLFKATGQNFANLKWM